MEKSWRNKARRDSHEENEVRDIAERWLEEYNTIRPHEALQGLSPSQYATQNA